MRIARRLSELVAIAALLALAALPARAQLFRAYLSGAGSDANPCTLQQPCRLLPAGLAAVQEGGEIWMLDSANYNGGPVIIQKAVTILAVPGVLGSVVGSHAIWVLTAGTVTLRNLNVSPLPGGEAGVGIRKEGAGKLHVQDAHVFGFTDGGTAIWGSHGADLTISGSVLSGNASGLVVSAGAVAGVSDSLIAGNWGYGVYLFAGDATASFTRTRFRGNERSLVADGTSAGTSLRITVNASSIDCGGFGEAGIRVNHVAGGTTSTTVSNTSITGCFTGVAADGPATVKLFLARNTITDNLTGVHQSTDSVVESTGTNAIRNNGTDVQGTVTNVGSM